MGYFVSGYKISHLAHNELRNCFLGVVPPELHNDSLEIKADTTFLSAFGANKTISDIVCHDEKTSSWLALLGTPLTDLRAEDEKSRFVRRFFEDPGGVVSRELDGCYVLLSHNSTTDTFYVATDYVNTTPVYYATTPTGIYFSSHELPLARFLKAEIDPLGFSMTIQLMLTWGSHSRFKNIHKLLPCQLVTFKGSEMTGSEQYWRPSDESLWPPKFGDVVDKWLDLLKNSVQAFHSCSSNKTVICEITGGEDARLLLSQCHALRIPFLATVDGAESDSDVIVAKQASQRAGFDLKVRPRPLISKDQLLAHATDISLLNDAYDDFFSSCSTYAMDVADPPNNYEYVRYSGAPGGEAFRGSYYLRGKAIFPSGMYDFDYKFFIRMKYLLDYTPGLLRFPDAECRQEIFTLVEKALDDVRSFPVGIRIDHLLNVFQTCNTGLMYKNPRYLPFATPRMTRSIYNIPPRFKRGGKLTRACTEILYPELAFVKTQKGVPTVRRTLSRSFLFMPEHITTMKWIMSGAMSRLFKWTDSNKPRYEWSRNANAIKILLNNPPYSRWFSSSNSLLTGYLYESDVVDSILKAAKERSTRNVPILGRILAQELACRWVYGED